MDGGEPAGQPIATVDLTNLDDEDVVPARRRQGSARKGKRSGGKKSPAKAQDVVDLTSDTPSPPDRRAVRSCSGGGAGAMGKVVLDFEDEEQGEAASFSAVGGAGGRARQVGSKRIRGQDIDSGCCSSSTRDAFRSTIVAGSCPAKQRADDGDPNRTVSCPVCSKDLKAGERNFLSCDHWACSECLTKVLITASRPSVHVVAACVDAAGQCLQLVLGEGRCNVCKARISTADMRQFMEPEQVRLVVRKAW